ncbi:metacaspase-5-like [Cicer arietinum]|uniref:Metacaspase-6-like n=1 Tax=Cicer arietinum TaxID=3827 RepID=A0A1S2Z0U8_CICAR|nr:metacaspase-6-like [Cicer arietinum]
MVTKRALVVALNYNNAKHNSRLRASISFVRDNFGYKENIYFIHDDIGQSNDNSVSFILTQLRHLITSSVVGDKMVFYFAGHRNYKIFTDNNGVEHMQQYLICGEKFIYFGGLTQITDKELTSCLNILPKDGYLTMIVDCCRSGNLIDGLDQQLACKGRRGIAYILDIDVAKNMLHRQHQLVSLFSACQKNQVAWEIMKFVDGQLKVVSIFTDTLLKIVHEKGGRVTNRELMTEVNKFFSIDTCIQTSGLFCADEHSYALFIGGRQSQLDPLRSIY